MKSHVKRTPRRLVLRREQVRQLDANQLGRLHGGLGGYSAGPCTESCAGCRVTTGIHSDDC
jgi:hypothetical protein